MLCKTQFKNNHTHSTTSAVSVFSEILVSRRIASPKLLWWKNRRRT